MNRSNLAGLKSSISSCAGINRICIREGFSRPVQQSDALANCTQQYFCISQPRQVEVLSEVFCQLLDINVLASPKRYAVELQPESSRSECCNQQFIVVELLGSPDSERILTLQPDLLPLQLWGSPFVRSLLGVFLPRYQEPLECLRDTLTHGLFCLFAFRVGLLLLKCVQV